MMGREVGREEDKLPYRHFGVAVWDSYKAHTMLRRCSWRNGSSSRSCMAPQLLPSRGAILLTVTYHRVGKMAFRKADQLTLYSRDNLYTTTKVFVITNS